MDEVLEKYVGDLIISYRSLKRSLDGCLGLNVKEDL